MQAQMNTRQEIAGAIRNGFWAKRLIYETAGWPSNFDQTEFCRLRDSWNAEYYQIVNIRNGFGAGNVYDLQQGGRLREMYRRTAGRYAV